MKSDKTINAIIHEVNVAHGIDCNEQARYHIAKQCRIARTEFERKWNELGVWLIDNTDASVADIQAVRAILNRGESVRGVKPPRNPNKRPCIARNITLGERKCR